MGFVASQSLVAQTVLTGLQERYGHTGPEEPEVVVALGGNGFMQQYRNRVDDHSVYL